MNPQKLNLPEAAPKDGTMILGHFGYPWLVPSAWNGYDEEWVCATLQVGQVDGEWTDRYFENEREKADQLKGWLPLPAIPDNSKK